MPSGPERNCATWRSPLEPRVPLIRCEVKLTASRDFNKSYFVLPGQRYSEDVFQQHLREFRAPRTDENRQRELLYTMRDQGVSRPRRALQLLRSLQAEGVIAKELGGVIADLELARDYPHAR